MTTQTVTLIAAVLAAIASIGNVYFSYLSTSTIEGQKIERVQENEKRKELRDAVQAFGEELAKGIWETNWLLWHAVNAPSSFSEARINSYDEHMAKILPRLLTTRAIVAAHDERIYDQLTELAGKFYALDVEIAQACEKYRSSHEIGMAQLAQLYPEALAFHQQLGDELAEIFASNAAKVVY